MYLKCLIKYSNALDYYRRKLAFYLKLDSFTNHTLPKKQQFVTLGNVYNAVKYSVTKTGFVLDIYVYIIFVFVPGPPTISV